MVVVMGKFGVLHPPDTLLCDAQSYLALTGEGKRVGPYPLGVTAYFLCYSDRGCYLVSGKPSIPRRGKLLMHKPSPCVSFDIPDPRGGCINPYHVYRITDTKMLLP